MQKISRNRYVRLLEDEMTLLQNNGDLDTYRAKCEDIYRLRTVPQENIVCFEDMDSGDIEYILT